ncbi:hypothetical protein M5K25_008659 [Dendrobium thyrsiflorum]|uniref:Uncharacterized protein n=1 Tax=Dendrobium thyrsiflorum TaxID=117978 RepID=A0ABD0V9I8_DENTH
MTMDMQLSGCVLLGCSVKLQQIWYQSLIVGRGDDRSWQGTGIRGIKESDSLWANQECANRRIDELAAEVQRLTLEIHREFNLNRARPPPPRMHREEPPVNRPLGRRGLAADRHWRQHPVFIQELSDSDEEAHLRTERLKNMNPTTPNSAQSELKWVQIKDLKHLWKIQITIWITKRFQI